MKGAGNVMLMLYENRKLRRIAFAGQSLDDFEGLRRIYENVLTVVTKDQLVDWLRRKPHDQHLQLAPKIHYNSKDLDCTGSQNNRTIYLRRVLEDTFPHDIYPKLRLQYVAGSWLTTHLGTPDNQLVFDQFRAPWDQTVSNTHRPSSFTIGQLEKDCLEYKADRAAKEAAKQAQANAGTGVESISESEAEDGSEGDASEDGEVDQTGMRALTQIGSPMQRATQLGVATGVVKGKCGKGISKGKGKGKAGKGAREQRLHANLEENKQDKFEKKGIELLSILNPNHIINCIVTTVGYDIAEVRMHTERM